jgi:hypothetical protein
MKPSQMQYLMSKIKGQKLLTNNMNNLSSAAADTLFPSGI